MLLRERKAHEHHCQVPISALTIPPVQGDPSETIRPWSQVVEEVRGAIGLSQDDLAHNARAFGAQQTLTGSQISQIKNGKRPYSSAFFEGIAGALGISPFRFAEYHLAKARDLIDEKQVGLDDALANIDRLPELIGELSEGPAILAETKSAIDHALAQGDAPAATGTEGRPAQRARGRA